MIDKPVIETSKFKKVIITIQYVFRANFNDTYWLEDEIINLDDLDKEGLTWFDPFKGRSKFNNTLVSIKYVSNDKFIILKKKDNIINEIENECYIDHIICEDYDQSMMLAAHIRLSTK